MRICCHPRSYFSRLFERDVRRADRQADRRFIMSVRARVRLAYTNICIYYYIWNARAAGHRISSGRLFVWPEILRFGMAGCHGMMSW